MAKLWLGSQMVELRTRLHEIIEGDAIENAMWRYIENQLQGVLMFYQRRQLFKDSTGADGIKLGEYKNESRSKGRELTRGEKRKSRSGEYTMVYSGSFYDDLQVTVNKSNKTITFYSEAGGHIHEMVANTGVFNTVDFFGLTDKNIENIIRRHIKKYLREWTEAKLTKKKG